MRLPRSRSESLISRFKSLKKCFDAYSERQQQHGDRRGRDWHPAETRGRANPDEHGGGEFVGHKTHPLMRERRARRLSR